jgi:hypothetical protein
MPFALVHLPMLNGLVTARAGAFLLERLNVSD